MFRRFFLSTHFFVNSIVSFNAGGWRIKLLSRERVTVLAALTPFPVVGAAVVTVLDAPVEVLDMMMAVIVVVLVKRDLLTAEQVIL